MNPESQEGSGSPSFFPSLILKSNPQQSEQIPQLYFQENSEPKSEEMKAPLKGTSENSMKPLSRPQGDLDKNQRELTGPPIPSESGPVLQSSRTSAIAGDIMETMTDYYSDLKKMELEPNLSPDYAKISLLRAKLINWINDTLGAIELDEKNIYGSTAIIDRFFDLSKIKRVEGKELHLVGIVAMLISSKFIDAYPLKMELCVSHIGKGEFTAKQILDKEKEVLETIEWRIKIPTVYEFLEVSSQMFPGDKKNKEEIMKNLNFLGKICCLDNKIRRCR